MKPSNEEALEMSLFPVSAPRSIILLFLAPMFFTSLVVAQTTATTGDPSVAVPQWETTADKLAAMEIASEPVDKSAYVLGTGDQLSVRVFGADDIPDRPMEVGSDGMISLPMVGRVQASGVSVRNLEANLTARYRTYFKNPQISITVTDYRSQAVTVVGAVNTPGVVQLRGPTRLMRVISQSGGLKPEAGDKILITRRLPSSGATTAPSSSATGLTESNASFYLKEINLLKIIDGTDPSANLIVEAGDLISVPRAKMVYVIGDVGKPGGYVLDGHSSNLTVLKVIALAGGVNKSAAYGSTRILRPATGTDTPRAETQIDLKKIMASKSPDIPLHADDILFVPNSLVKAVSVRAIETAVSVGTGILIWK
jgi:polysaccharide export outer membrane protein